MLENVDEHRVFSFKDLFGGFVLLMTIFTFCSTKDQVNPNHKIYAYLYIGLLFVIIYYNFLIIFNVNGTN